MKTAADYIPPNMDLDDLVLLIEALKTWRRAECAHARAVLIANYPDHVKALSDVSEKAALELRIIVDRMIP